MLGLIVAIGVLGFAFVYGNPNPLGLLDAHGAIIVIGGTFACVSVAFRLDRAAKMFFVFVRGFFGAAVPPRNKIILELMGMAESYRQNSPDLAQKVEKASDPFLRESMQALMDKVVEDKDLIRVLRARVETMYERYTDEAKMFTACGKYPPAMGLMGAVLGMILLLGSLGTEGAESRIGPSMSVALIATLDGIIVANLFIIPIGENLQEIARQIRQKNLIIVEGIRFIALKSNPIRLAEELNSYLLPAERVDWKKLKQGG